MDQKKKTLQELRRERARKRDKRVLLSLSVFLMLLFMVYLVTNSPQFHLPKFSFSWPKWSLTSSPQKEEQPEVEGKFSKGQQMLISPAAIEEDPSLAPYQNRLARVESLEQIEEGDKQNIVYTLNFGRDEKVSGIAEDFLAEEATGFALGQEVELLDRVGSARVETITKTDDYETYSVTLEDGQTVDSLSFHQLAYVYDIPLDATALPRDNNQLIQEAMDLTSQYSFVVVRFPKGQYRIGSATPESEYLLLRSNVELRGQETELIVEGSARWFGLATGVTGYDGVSHFLMNGLTFKASDLVNGNQLLIMTNHGYGWQIENNQFSMVHKMSSHIFDLGGLQDSVFNGNRFEGYAPELTQVTEIGDRDLHNFYAEAIQLDTSHNISPWDGGMMRAIDPNYDWTTSQPVMSNNITISHNAFLPYYNPQGQLVAYGATVGQHSSYVGMTSIFGNTFENTLATRYKDQTSDQWVLEPVHLQSNAPVDIRDNNYQ
ncbi:hypothetical protein ACVRYP_03070 [Streptococcus rifensis]